MTAGQASVRLTVVMTHPVQYYAPWFRFIAERAPGIDLTVLYASAPTPGQQGSGFDTAFAWDTPLTEGYDARVVRPPHPGDRFDAESFRGLDVRGIGRHIAATRPDVLLIPGWHSIVLVRALAAAWRLRVPAIYRGDTHLGNAPSGWRGRLWRSRTWALLRLFSAYLAVGSRARDYLLAFGIDRRRVFDAPHSVDNDRFAAAAAPYQTAEARADLRRSLAIDPGAFVAAFVGKFQEKKHPTDLIRAAAGATPRPVLLLVGAGPLEREMRNQADALGVTCRFAGFVNQSQIGRMYAAADCLVLPSDWGETWGLVVNEALATGLPVVASDRVGCVPDLVDDLTGATFRFGDTGDLARALSAVRTRCLAIGYSSACRARSAAFGFEAATAGLLDACRSVAWPAGRRSQAATEATPSECDR